MRRAVHPCSHFHAACRCGATCHLPPCTYRDIVGCGGSLWHAFHLACGCRFGVLLFDLDARTVICIPTERAAMLPHFCRTAIGTRDGAATATVETCCSALFSAAIAVLAGFDLYDVCRLVSQRRHAPVSASNAPQIIWALLVRGHSCITMALTAWSTAVPAAGPQVLKMHMRFPLASHVLAQH
jgi:hypothetical protein